MIWTDNDPKCIDLLRVCASENLFEIHSDLRSLLSRNENTTQEDEKEAKRIDALSAALEAPFSEIGKYVEYIEGNAIFDTHQGVKGLQFYRVMVVIDDVQAQGTTFNYGKLFGTVPKSKTDIENEQKGKESTIDRTRRLLYVTCSRAIAIPPLPRMQTLYHTRQGWSRRDQPCLLASNLKNLADGQPLQSLRRRAV